MTGPNLANLQGDLFSRGFPKYNETYYFFSIVPGKEKEFSKSLAALGKSGHISSLEKVLNDWKAIDKSANDVIIPVSNALIAFSSSGLGKLQLAVLKGKLDLDKLAQSDPAFAAGMAVDGPKNLNDPPVNSWDPLFKSRTTPIHGVLKVAGNSPAVIDSKLNEIKKILGHPTTIVDIAGNSPPTTVNSRVDGQVRPKSKGLKGHEHFGFRDGVSQPLLKNVDSDATFNKTPSMQTAQNVITVTKDPPTPQDGVNASPEKRPGWMVDGSFLVFRKLEQNVQAFLDLTAKFKDAGCKSADEFGAKLMGRWKNGAPIVLHPTSPPQPPTNPTATNTFDYTSTSKAICPLAAHIRKTNPRDGTDKTFKARIIRNGIPYGSEFVPSPIVPPNPVIPPPHSNSNPTSSPPPTKPSPSTAPAPGAGTNTRGLLFTAYSSSIDNGFAFIQRAWSNNPSFPQWRDPAGYDVFSGQAPDEGQLSVTLFEEGEDEDVLSPGVGEFKKLVTMRGGEYFFVPSLNALQSTLGTV